MNKTTRCDYVESAWRIYPVAAHVGAQRPLQPSSAFFTGVSSLPDDLLLVVEQQGVHWVMGTLAADQKMPEVIDWLLIKYPSPLSD